jgi:hypothetical protein
MPQSDNARVSKTNRTSKALDPQTGKDPLNGGSARNLTLTSKRKHRKNRTEREIVPGWSTPWAVKTSESSLPPQWQPLDHTTIISDYVYGGNASLPFGESIPSALNAVAMELVNSFPIETPEFMEEEQAYNRSLRSRARLMGAEKNMREKEKSQFEEMLRQFQAEQRKLKKTPEQLEYEAFLERPVYYSLSKTIPTKFESTCGVERCRLCDISRTDASTKVGTIDAPAVRPSNVTDSWREKNVEDEPETTGFGIKATSTAQAIKRRRTSRRSHRSSNKIGLMLLEVKHSLEFLEEYNSGYIKSKGKL